MNSYRCWFTFQFQFNLLSTNNTGSPFGFFLREVKSNGPPPGENRRCSPQGVSRRIVSVGVAVAVSAATLQCVALGMVSETASMHGGTAWRQPRQAKTTTRATSKAHLATACCRQGVQDRMRKAAQSIRAALGSMEFSEYQPAVREANDGLPRPPRQLADVHVDELQGPRSTRQIARYDRSTDWTVDRSARATVISVPRDAVWCQPRAAPMSQGRNGPGPSQLSRRQRPEGRLNARLKGCGDSKQSLQARLLAQVAIKLQAKADQRTPETTPASRDEDRDRSKENRQEETQTMRFLGRMRAAVATDETLLGPSPGQQLWAEKEASAHALYSRRLTLVEEELASLRAGKQKLAEVIADLKTTNKHLEEEMQCLPPLINKTFQLENNLLLRGRDAAGVWPQKKRLRQQQGAGVQRDACNSGACGGARPGVNDMGGGEPDSVSLQTYTLAELPQEEAPTRLLIAGRHSLRVTAKAAAGCGGTGLGALVDPTSDALKQQLASSLNELSDRVSGISGLCHSRLDANEGEDTGVVAAADAQGASGDGRACCGESSGGHAQVATDAAAAHAHGGTAQACTPNTAACGAAYMAKKATGGLIGEGVRGLDLDSRSKDEDEGFEEESRTGSGAEEGDDDEPLLRARRLLAAFSTSGL